VSDFTARDKRRDIFAEYLESIQEQGVDEPSCEELHPADKAEPPEGADSEDSEASDSEGRNVGEGKSPRGSLRDNSPSVQNNGKSKRRPVWQPDAALRLPPGGKESWSKRLPRKSVWIPSLIKLIVAVSTLVGAVSTLVSACQP